MKLVPITIQVTARMSDDDDASSLVDRVQNLLDYGTVQESFGDANVRIESILVTNVGELAEVDDPEPEDDDEQA